MKSRNITVRAPTPALPLKGGREFQAYHYNDIAITTSNAAHSPRNDKTVLPCLRHPHNDILLSAATLKNFKT